MYLIKLTLHLNLLYSRDAEQTYRITPIWLTEISCLEGFNSHFGIVTVDKSFTLFLQDIKDFILFTVMNGNLNIPQMIRACKLK